MPLPSTYTPIASQVITGSTTMSVAFNNIPQNYTDLKVIVNTGYTFTDAVMYLEFNGSSAAVYSGTDLNGTGSSATSGRMTNATYFGNAGWYPYPNDATVLGTGIYDIMNYSNSTTFKSLLMRLNNTVSGSSGLRVGLFRSTSPITALRFFLGTYQNPYFTVGATFTLYGIKAA